MELEIQSWGHGATMPLSSQSSLALSVLVCFTNSGSLCVSEGPSPLPPMDLIQAN